MPPQSKQLPYDLLISNGRVLTLGPDFQEIYPGRVGIIGGMIASVEPDVEPAPSAKTVINARGGLVLPGLVNTHTHAAMTLFRGLADDLPLYTWLMDHIFPAEATWVSAEMVYWCSLLACGEMLLSGTTCFSDGYFFEIQVARAAQIAGMRAVCAQGVIDFPAPGVPDPSQNIAMAAEFIDQTKNLSPLITPGVFPHSPSTCSAETLYRVRDLAEGKGAALMIHLAETKHDRDQTIEQNGLSPTAWLDYLGFFDHPTPPSPPPPPPLAVHCVWVDDDDIAILARKGVAVAHCCLSNLKLGSGIAPVDKLLEAGIPVGLGTDGAASNNAPDIFTEARITALLQKGVSLDPTVISAQETLRMATTLGARALGLRDRIGSIEPGKRADLIVINTDSPHLTPMYDPVSALVYAAKGSDVQHVIVDGNVVVKEGEIISFDLEEAKDRVRRLAAKVRE